MWHVSAQANTGNLAEAKRLAYFALRGVGDPELGEWEGVMGRPTIWHIQRRLTEAEREAFNVPEPIDIRGSDEEERRIRTCLVERR